MNKNQAQEQIKKYATPRNIVALILGSAVLYLAVSWINYPGVKRDSIPYVESLGAVSCSSPDLRTYFEMAAKNKYNLPVYTLDERVKFADGGEGYCQMYMPDGTASGVYFRVGYRYFWDYIFGSKDADVVWYLDEE